MKIISTTEFRNKVSEIINSVSKEGEPIVVGRRGRSEAVVIRFPNFNNKDVNDITNMNAYSTSFDFLKEEPDIYSVDDLKQKYV